MAKRKNRPVHPVQKTLTENRAAIGAVAAVAAIGAAAGAFLLRRRADASEEGVGGLVKQETTTPPAVTEASAAPVATGAEHVPTDLMGDHHPGPDERAVDAFRPDPTAPVPPDERDALRPATGAPTLVAGQAPELERLT